MIRLTRDGGLSLPELIVSVSIVGLLSALSVVSFASFFRNQALDASSASLVFALRDARTKTLASVEGYQYGVAVSSDRHTLFRGPALVSGDSSNQVFLLSSLTRASSSLQSFVFERVTGNSSASGTIDVYITSDPTLRRKVTVQGTGLVDMQ
jgi:prepilin-type N-terminal cleavage/methylation domain-containing protein